MKADDETDLGLGLLELLLARPAQLVLSHLRGRHLDGSRWVMSLNGKILMTKRLSWWPIPRNSRCTRCSML